MITHVAIIWKGKLYSLARPYRHHDVIHMIFNLTNAQVYYSWQGFLVDADHGGGKFVGRKEACKIASRAGQLNIVRPKTSPHDVLFSEDVW